MPETQPMTAEQARTFEHGMSLANYQQLKVSLMERRSDCRCEPYTDCFTFRRWKAQGRSVRKGEKSHRLTCWIEGEKEDQETGEVKTFKRPWTAHVFCRCQVDEV